MFLLIINTAIADNGLTNLRWSISVVVTYHVEYQARICLGELFEDRFYFRRTQHDPVTVEDGYILDDFKLARLSMSSLRTSLAIYSFLKRETSSASPCTSM